MQMTTYAVFEMLRSQENCKIPMSAVLETLRMFAEPGMLRMS